MPKSDLKFHSTPFVCPDDLHSLDRFNQETIQHIIQLMGIPDFDTPLNGTVIYTADDGAFWRKKVRYGHATDDIVWAWLFVPKELNTPVPAIICLPGSFMTPNWGKDGPAGLAGPWEPGQPEAYGADLARLGSVTLCPDYPCAGERTSPGLNAYDTSELTQRHPTWTRVGLSARDVSRAVDFLLTIPEVDEDRIGCTGWSQGGQMTLIGAALDKRIKAIASVCGWSPLRGLPDSAIKNLIQDYNFPLLHPYATTPQKLPFDFDHLAALVAPRPYLDIRAKGDVYFPNVDEINHCISEIGNLYSKLGKSNHFRSVWVEGKHAFTATAAREVQAWFYTWFWP